MSSWASAALGPRRVRVVPFSQSSSQRPPCFELATAAAMKRMPRKPVVYRRVSASSEFAMRKTAEICNHFAV